MDIKRAKEEIKNTVRVYLLKNEFGEYKIPTIQQRPILLIGSPGIGKTAIMEQIARECKIGLVAYTITHHTRQSAIGLPFIEKRQYNKEEYSITKYTMSEIVASVYEKIEETDLKEGILFIDEINCISETLAPTMLQFLQAKAFGNHKIPKGWIIVAAGNPPEYNKSVREFDIVTLDRVRKINVEENFSVWKEYAYQHEIHGSILSYLEIKKENFYHIETTVEGKRFVTARGWADLSQIIYIYEELNISIDEAVIFQYLQHEKIAKDFSNYLDFYNKYKEDYQIDIILKGEYQQKLIERLKEAPFDEKLSIIGLLLSKLNIFFVIAYQNDLYVTELYEEMKKFKEKSIKENLERLPEEILIEQIEEKENKIVLMEKSGLLDKEEKHSTLKVIEHLEKYKRLLKEQNLQDLQASFELLKDKFQLEVEKRQNQIYFTQNVLKNAFLFLEKVFGRSQEMVIFITELTANYYSMKFIRENGSKEYYEFNKEILLSEQQQEIIQDINRIKELL